MSAHAHELAGNGGSLSRVAALATLHCLTGCAIGEVLGLVIGTALGWSNAATIALAVFLAFVFGYSLTMLPLLRSGLAFIAALPIAFAADSFSIAVMELVDNGVMLAVPGAMDSPLTNPLFWSALAFALAVAYVVAFPVNRYLIARGKGHAVVHAYHGGGDAAAAHGDAEHAHSHDHHGNEHSHHAHGHNAGAAGYGGATHPGSPRKLIAFGLAAMAATIGIAAGGAAVVESRGHAGDDAPTMSDGAHGGSAGAHLGPLGGLAVAADGYRLELRATEVVAGRTTRLRFTVVGGDGPVRDFDEHGGVAMHLIVVRRDLTGYRHLHPTLQPDGSWETELTLAEAGVYRAYADFERGGKKTVLASDLFVGGAFAPVPLPRPATRVEIGRYLVELDAHAEAGTEATLDYRITRDGDPVEVQPYLGAAGHLVALRAGDAGYLHVHPLADAAGAVRFRTVFPTAGEYRLFLQVKHAGRVHTAPLTIRVGGHQRSSAEGATYSSPS